MQRRRIIALLSLSWLICAAAQAQNAEPIHGAEARQSVARAEALFQVGNYDAALVDFSRAYALLADYPRRYVVLHNIAACYERVFRYDEALRYYERYLSEGGPEAEGRAAVEAALATLRGMLATLRVEANVRAEVWIDARRRGEVPATLNVPAGRHRIEVRAPFYESVQRELTLEAGATYRLPVELEPLSTYRGPDRSLFYASAITTGTLLVAAAVLGSSTVAARNRGLAQAGESMQLRTARLERAEADVRGWSVATDLTLGAAALFGATSLLLYLLTDWSSEHRDARPQTAHSPSALRLVSEF